MLGLCTRVVDHDLRLTASRRTQDEPATACCIDSLHLRKSVRSLCSAPRASRRLCCLLELPAAQRLSSSHQGWQQVLRKALGVV